MLIDLIIFREISKKAKRILLRILSALLIITFFGDCKKYGHGYIKGTVLEKGTDIPIQGASVVFQFLDKCSTCNWAYDSTYTDSKGNFIFYFRSKLSHEYHINIHDENHYGTTEEIKYRKNDHIYYLDPKAYLKFRVKKTSNSQNFISFDNCSGGGEFHYDFKTLDSILPKTCTVRGNTETSINWILNYFPFQNKEPDFFYNNVFINKEDTLVFLIQYD